MDSNIKEKALNWINSQIDEDSRKEIQRMIDSAPDELVESFYKDLEFGTGGLRGIMGIGSNRMNKYTVGMATQGLANYLLKSFPGEQIKVAIAYDSRNNSHFFAETTAAVFSANGFIVYFFENLRPTPELSFAVRELKCHSGVVITASHNPKEYNGYKAYWNDGAQLVPPHDENVIKEVEKITRIDQINFNKVEKNIKLIGRDIDEKYLELVKKLSVSPEAVQRQANLKIVYTSIHGTGITLVPEALKMKGFTNVTVVEEQATPDGNFPTVVSPNPEEPAALKIALEKAKQIDADLLLGTDPDADRVGIAIKNKKGEFELMNGNQTASMLIYYLLQSWKEKGKITGNEYIVKTIVTTDLISAIADTYKVECLETLTGFKYIAQAIHDLEGKKTFIAGGEESYGYLISDFVRDKDAIASVAMIAEMAAYAKDQGKSLYDLLMEVYAKFGYYREHLISLTKKGKSGAEEIQAMMVNLRNNPPKTINGSRLVKLIDYKKGTQLDVQSGKESKINFPVSDVLQYITEDGSKISARPSGTEPKIKFYFGVKEKLSGASEFEAVNQKALDKIKSIIKDMKLE